MKVIYYYHVPKCGGAFIRRNLSKLSREIISTKGEFPEHHGQLDNSALYEFTIHTGDYVVSEDSRKKLKNFLKTLPDLKYDYVFVHHHHRQCGLKELLPDLKECSNKLGANGDEFYMFTVLREVIPFITSRVNYSKEYKLKIGGLPASFDTHLPNYQARYLLYNSSFWAEGRIRDERVDKADIKEILNFLNKTYTTNNLKELESDLRNLINNDMGWDKSRVNITKKKIPPTEEQKAQLLKKNDIDVWLYNYIKKN